MKSPHENNKVRVALNISNLYEKHANKSLSRENLDREKELETLNKKKKPIRRMSKRAGQRRLNC